MIPIRTPVLAMFFSNYPCDTEAGETCLLLENGSYVCGQPSDCPIPSGICTLQYAPVDCGGCEYSNQCFATSADPSFTPETCTPVVEPTPVECPSVDEPCMNKDNFHACKDIVDSGCKKLLILESCPLQFDCGDPKYQACGGIAGIPCNEGLTCVTGINGDCDEDCGGRDCLGECRQVLEGKLCAGFAGFQCPRGYECVVAKGDGCSPNCGGADCGGICLAM